MFDYDRHYRLPGHLPRQSVLILRRYLAPPSPMTGRWRLGRGRGLTLSAQLQGDGIQTRTAHRVGLLLRDAVRSAASGVIDSPNWMVWSARRGPVGLSVVVR